MNIFGHAISMPQLYGQLLIGLINGSFYALLESGPCRHFRHAHDRQLRPRRVLHDGGLRRLFSASIRRPQLLVGAHPVAARDRRDRSDRRAAVPEAARRLRSALQPAAHLRPGADHPGPVPELFRRLGPALRDPQTARRRLQSRLHVPAGLSRLGDPRLSDRVPGDLAHRSRRRSSAPICAPAPRTRPWCAPSASMCRAWSR